MRFLLHFIGDIHQPLHTTARVNDDYPKGDKGGNDFPLPNHYSAKNLHSVWDKVVYEFKYSAPLPFTEESWESIGIISKEYLK